MAILHNRKSIPMKKLLLALYFTAITAFGADLKDEKIKLLTAQIAVVQAQLDASNKALADLQAAYWNAIGAKVATAQKALNDQGMASCKAMGGSIDLAGITCPAETKTAPDAKKN